MILTTLTTFAPIWAPMAIVFLVWVMGREIGKGTEEEDE